MTTSSSSSSGSGNSLRYLQEDKESSLGGIKVDLMRTRPVRTTFSEGQGYCDKVQHCPADQTFKTPREARGGP